jgi:subtilisin family serine protease
VTDPDNSQASSSFETDPTGHGTDVSGIAGEDTGNNFGFSAAGGNSSILAYRVFPTPDDNCTPGNPAGATDPQCSSSTDDIASAIKDAINNHANVISMSLGGGGCDPTTGADEDPVEGNAVAEAIAANVVVVAAAGNDSSPPLEAPACDPGVIAVGASAIADGQPTGTSANGTAPGTGLGSASAPVEYVASYSDTGTPALALNSASAWGIVAPGADPNDPTTSANDPDLLHWVTNIWTTMPFDSNFAGACVTDFPSNATGTDCQILIAGTSMATPHVAGAAALIIAATGTKFQSPTLMKQLLCATADDIQDPNEGCGRLNVYRAMAVALGDPNPPVTPSSLLRR